MEREEIFKRLTEIFQLVMENDEIKLQECTCSDDIEEWDSLSHVQLIDAIQKSFKVRITAKELVTWANVGQMVDSIQEKMK